MAPRPLDAALDAILRGTSRSFYLTLRVVPRTLRGPLGLAYLFCRAADTIADTRLLPRHERLVYLATYRAQFAGDSPPALDGLVEAVGAPLANPHEAELLRALPQCFAALAAMDPADRVLIERLVTTLARGMESDLERFPIAASGEVAGLENDDELDRYCYWVAGCVGEFWTDLSMLRLRALRSWDADHQRAIGIRFGKGLQLTNILRDVDGDLRIGRCYLPRSRLAALGLDARALRDATDRRAVRPVIDDLLRTTLAYFDAGWEYTLSIPRRLPALRLACTWPLWIGLRTLELLAAADDPCAPGVVCKIDRREVRRLIASSTLRVLSTRALDRAYRKLAARVVARLDRGATRSSP